jgi:hypothetical protein
VIELPTKQAFVESSGSDHRVFGQRVERALRRGKVDYGCSVEPLAISRVVLEVPASTYAPSPKLRLKKNP